MTERLHIWTVDRLLVCVPAGRGGSLERDLRSLLARSPSVDAVLELLAREGLSATPPFVCAAAQGEGVRVVIRGELEVVAHGRDGSSLTLGAGRAATWHDDVVTDIASISVELTDGGRFEWLAVEPRAAPAGAAEPGAAPAGAAEPDATPAGADQPGAPPAAGPAPVAAEHPSHTLDEAAFLKLVEGTATTATPEPPPSAPDPASDLPAARREPSRPVPAGDMPAARREQSGPVDFTSLLDHTRAPEAPVPVPPRAPAPPSEPDPAPPPPTEPPAPPPPTPPASPSPWAPPASPSPSAPPASPSPSAPPASPSPSAPPASPATSATPASPSPWAPPASPSPWAPPAPPLPPGVNPPRRGSRPPISGVPTSFARTDPPLPPLAPGPPPPPPLPPDTGTGLGEHDGRTITLSDLRRLQSESAGDSPAPPPAEDARQPRPREVRAVRCPDGHANPPTAVTCRLCGQEVSDSAVVTVPRPVVARLVFESGLVVDVDRPQLIGRRPTTPPEAEEIPNLVTVPSPDGDISRAHAAVRLEGWDVLVEDVGSTNGTEVRLPGRDPVRLREHDLVLVVAGTEVTLAGSVRFTVEAAEQ